MLQQICLCGVHLVSRMESLGALWESLNFRVREIGRGKNRFPSKLVLRPVLKMIQPRVPEARLRPAADGSAQLSEPSVPRSRSAGLGLVSCGKGASSTSTLLSHAPAIQAHPGEVTGQSQGQGFKARWLEGLKTWTG